MCEHVSLAGGGSAVVCGVRQKRQRCVFCGAPGNRLCDWKTEKPKKILASKLAMGDVIETRQNKLHLPVQVVSRPEMLYGASQYVMYGLQFPDGRCFLYYVGVTEKVLVLRPGTCDKPCCEKCSRSVDEDRDYCREHWETWQFDTALDQRMVIDA